jgi:hypothetical protein
MTKTKAYKRLLRLIDDYTEMIYAEAEENDHAAFTTKGKAEIDEVKDFLQTELLKE